MMTMTRSLVRMGHMLLLLLYLAGCVVAMGLARWRWADTWLSNCAIFAFTRECQRGGHVIFTRSKYGWWYHIRYAAAITAEVEEFVPNWDGSLWRWAFPPILMRGRVAKHRVGA